MEDCGPAEENEGVFVYCKNDNNELVPQIE